MKSTKDYIKTDHNLIRYNYNIKFEAPRKLTQNPAKFDQVKFNEYIENGLEYIPNPKELNYKEELDAATEQLDRLILEAYNYSNPPRISNKTNNAVWWNDDLQQLKKEVNRVYLLYKKKGN